MTFGKPDAGKPPVRFDEGRSDTVIGLVPLQPVRSAYSTNSHPIEFSLPPAVCVIAITNIVRLYYCHMATIAPSDALCLTSPHFLFI